MGYNGGIMGSRQTAQSLTIDDYSANPTIDSFRLVDCQRVNYRLQRVSLVLKSQQVKRTNTTSLKCFKTITAAPVGFEPTKTAVKVLCLTAWLRSITIYMYIISSLNIFVKCLYPNIIQNKGTQSFRLLSLLIQQCHLPPYKCKHLPYKF